MPRPTGRRGFPCAAQQRLRKAGSSIGRHRSGVFSGRAAVALLGLVLLCGASALHEFEIGIRDRRVEGVPSTLRVKRGDTVLLRWRTDEPVSLHVHGYDLRADLSSASPAAIRFRAGIAGRFPITAHGFGAAPDSGAPAGSRREVTLLYLEVLPE